MRENFLRIQIKWGFIMIQKSFIALGLASLISIASLDAMADGKGMAKKSGQKSKFFKGDNYVTASVILDQNMKFRRNSEIEKRVDSVAAYAIAYEKAFFDRMRLGVSYTYKPSKKVYYDNSNTRYEWGFKSHMALVTAKYDLIAKGDFVPYLSLGLGVSRNEPVDYIETRTTQIQVWKREKQTNFAWRAGLGLRMNSWKNVQTAFEYSYLDRGGIKTSATKITYLNGATPSIDEVKRGITKSHNIGVSLSYKF